MPACTLGPLDQTDDRGDVDNEVLTLLGREVTVGTLLIPVFAGLIGLFTNWVAIKMMFYPLEFIGWRLPFSLGFGKYKFPLIGWQGVIPSKAAKMGSVAVDTGLAKLGTMHEFYQTFEPDHMAAHIVATSREDLHRAVDEILEAQYPQMWHSAPAPVRRLVHARVESEMPRLVRELLDGIGDNIDHLINLKLMVIRFLEQNPKLINAMFEEVGEKEFTFIIRSGGWMGFLLGLGPMVLWIVMPQLWTVPIGAAIVGYLTNYIALKVIFEPIEPRRIGPFLMHGLFLRRQDEVAEAYADIIAYKVVTLPNIADTMLNGPDGDRTRRLVADTLGPAVDEAVGIARPFIRATSGDRFAAVKDGLADSAFSQIDALADPEYARERASGMQALLAERMRGLPYKEFSQLLRSAFEQDEWMLIVVGAVLGFGAGALQMLVTL